MVGYIFGAAFAPRRETRTFTPKVRNRVLGSVAIAAGLLFGVPSATYAQSAYVAGLAKNGVDTPFGILNLATGVYTNIGQTSFGLYGLSFVGSTLYGVGADGVLYRVNTSNAQLTSVGIIDNRTTGLAQPGSLTVASNGTVYNAQNTGNGSNTFLYTVNINGSNSSVTPVGMNGGNTGIVGNGGIAYDASTNTIFATQGDGTTNPNDPATYKRGFFSINPTTATGTLINADSGFIDNPVYSLFFGGQAANSPLYAIDNGQQASTGTIGHAYTINKQTGVATQLSQYDITTAGRIQASAFIVPADTPEPASASLMLMASGTLGGAFVVKRRAAKRSKAK